MKFRNFAMSAVAAATLGFAAIPAPAVAADIYFNVAPPAPRVEAVPAPRPGYVWSPGYWDLRGHRHHWVKGHWERARHGYRYHQPAWTERNGQWYLNKPKWARDNDHDGVPNSVDSRPNNPNRH